MVSTVTINRKKKIKLLRESLNNTIELLLLEHKQRDPIHMSRFKELSLKVKKMLEDAKIGKSNPEKFT